MSTKTIAVPKPEADALETLYEAHLKAAQAFAAIQGRIADGGKVQRLGPGAWILTRETPDPEPAE